MQEVWIRDYEGSPIHCPYCGQPHAVDGEIMGCEHMLYFVAFGEYWYRSKVFDVAAKIENILDEDDELNWDAMEKRGGVAGICKSVDLPNHIQFQVQSASDLALIGFANG